jgi:ribosomal protein S18 acetylase RimI-like enzyme
MTIKFQEYNGIIKEDKNTVYKKLETDEEISGAKQLIIAYIQWLNQDLCFQNIDDELKTFPKKYSEPEGAFLIAKKHNEVTGCVGIRKLENKICEMKRLFVSDNYRGNGTGKKLVEMIIEEAKLKHYEKMRLDTLDTMEEALNIYRKNGFYEIEAYYNNPADGVVYLEKTL